VFVGDEPSKTNINYDIAFVGARCFDRLVEWIGYINPKYYIVLNSRTQENLDNIKKLKSRGFLVVALGVKAKKRLDALQIENIPLPHPSGLCRKNNDKQYIQKELQKVKDML
jgi:uracil-DNA glycosylase